MGRFIFRTFLFGSTDSGSIEVSSSVVAVSFNERSVAELSNVEFNEVSTFLLLRVDLCSGLFVCDIDLVALALLAFVLDLVSLSSVAELRRFRFGSAVVRGSSDCALPKAIK